MNQQSPSTVVRFARLGPSARTPTLSHQGSAILELYCAKPAILWSNDGFVKISTHLAVELPDGFVGRIEGLPDLAVRCDMLVFSDLIGSNFRGELCILARNLNRSPIRVEIGMPIARLALHRTGITDVSLQEIASPTNRYRAAV
jgi:dUTPase